jgi:quercetin dioxygenase-like cupin family protein
MASSFTDHRGTITDLLTTPIDAVTQITTKAGAVRGNHVHSRTIQYTYIVSGRLRVAWREDDGVHERACGPGDLITEAPGIAHAWKAETDVICLVFTCGPRSGEAYESDTQRLEVPILT